MRKIKDNNGFTLIELLVVISIIGVLSSIVLTSLAEARGRARDAKWLTEVKQIQIALNIYRDANEGEYPAGITNGTQSGFETALAPLVPTYFSEIPLSANSATNGNLYYWNCSDLAVYGIHCSDYGATGYTDEGYMIRFTLESLDPNITKDDSGIPVYYIVGSPD